MIVRLYTGTDGKSHFEDLAYQARDIRTGLKGGAAAIFRRSEPGLVSDWHNTPDRRYVITLSGQVEWGLRDGTKRTFGPGDVMLLEDLTGQGHTTRVVGSQPWLNVAIWLP
jgi:hypothetical protein